MKVEPVSSTTCGLPNTIKVVRSLDKIPNPVETSHTDLVTAIGPTGILSPNFHFIPYNRAPYAGLNKYTKRMTFAFLLDSFVYIIGPESELLEKIKVEGVWQNPRDISNYMQSDDVTPSYDPDKDDYPLSTSMLDLIKTSMLAQNLSTLAQAPTDLSNNAKSDIQPNSQK